MVKALVSHPLRLRIVREVASAGEISPTQLAVILDEPLGNVSYHVRQLHEAKALRATREAPVRGTLQHFYAIDRAGLKRGLGELGREVAAVREAAGLGEETRSPKAAA